MSFLTSMMDAGLAMKKEEEAIFRASLWPQDKRVKCAHKAERNKLMDTDFTHDGRYVNGVLVPNKMHFQQGEEDSCAVCSINNYFGHKVLDYKEARSANMWLEGQPKKQASAYDVQPDLEGLHVEHFTEILHLYGEDKVENVKYPRFWPAGRHLQGPEGLVHGLGQKSWEAHLAAWPNLRDLEFAETTKILVHFPEHTTVLEKIRGDRWWMFDPNHRDPFLMVDGLIVDGQYHKYGIPGTGRLNWDLLTGIDLSIIRLMDQDRVEENPDAFREATDLDKMAEYDADVWGFRKDKVLLMEEVIDLLGASDRVKEEKDHREEEYLRRKTEREDAEFHAMSEDMRKAVWQAEWETHAHPLMVSRQKARGEGPLLKGWQRRQDEQREEAAFRALSADQRKEMWETDWANKATPFQVNMQYEQHLKKRQRKF
jgi:hypothetical protein